MLIVREDVPCKLLSLENKFIKNFHVEINLWKTKWLLCCSYSSRRNNIVLHLEHLNWNLALYLSCYQNLMIIGDFNVEVNNSAVSVFSDTYNLKSFLKGSTCHKSPNKPSCIGLILKNKLQNFKHFV